MIPARSAYANPLLTRRHATSLVELLAILIVLGLLASLVVPRLFGPSDTAKINACHANKGDIEIQVQLWYRNNGSFPAANLSDIGADITYFPEGLPTCPVNSTAYTIDTASGEVVGHDH